MIELLAVIAIIGLLIALLLPSVQGAREAARRSSCANNLRQLGIAVLRYESSAGYFPPGATADGGCSQPNNIGAGIGPNWAVLILPYMEMSSAYDASADAITAYVQKAMSNPPGIGGGTAWATSKTIVSQPIATHLCPSDLGNGKFWSNASAPGGASIAWARGNYGANAGAGYYGWSTTNVWSWIKSGAGTAADPYVYRESVSGSDGGYRSPGPGNPFKAGWVMGLNSMIQAAHLLDGASNTVLIGELRISASDLRGTWALGVPGASLVAGSGRADSPGPNISLVGYDDIQDCSPTGVGQPEIGMGCHNLSSGQVTLKSKHPGGVQATFCDGSVRWIADSISQLNYFRIHARCDGGVQPQALDE